jgi:hypothetical protein
MICKPRSWQRDVLQTLLVEITRPAESLAITADCNKPSIHATPSGHPVSFVNTVKTNLASVLGAVARMTADVAIQATIDQNTIMLVRNQAL